MRSTDTLGDVAARLARADVADWRGLPGGLDWRAHVDAEDPPAVGMLGAEDEPADMVRVADTASGTTARAWLRNDTVILIDVPVATGAESEGRAGCPSRPGPGVPEALGAPDRRLDVAIGFAPCSPDEYVRGLRVEFATVRRPLRRPELEDDL